MRELVHAAIQPLAYHDIAGTCGRDENCLCLSCWVRGHGQQVPFAPRCSWPRCTRAAVRSADCQ
jgi:hypothetical protein